MNKKVWSKEKIEKVEKYNVLLVILIIASVFLMFVFPPFIFLIIFLSIYKFNIKKQKKLRYELDKENSLIKQGYNKVCKGFFIDNNKHKLNILDREYGFSQIIDCELIENGTSISQTIGRTKVKNVRKLNTRYQTTQLDICTDLGVNITTNDFNNPRIMFDCKYEKNFTKNSKAYREALENAKNIIATLKIVIAQNNEKYIETGTITKVEHKYITEENASIQIERLSQLHKDGVLTDYEFEMKKKELLDKIK
jgi:hypothetical protein|nr:MAG TPA: Short C-terminal domain [Caudoviricetes sp.]